MKTKRFFLAAILWFALTFTLSCSGDGDGNNGDQSNISSGTETSSSSIAGDNSSSSKGMSESSSSNVATDNSSSSVAGQSSSSEGGTVKKDKISGFSQKGPFTKGSAITLSELNDKLAQTGRSFEEMITDDKGSFEIKNVELVSPYAVLKVNGFYRNEVTGKISTAPINLYAIADIREKSNVNVNILTHLEYYRVQKLVEGGKSLKDAKKQAQKEILAVFGISGEFEDSEDMSIFGTTDGDAALLAISVLLQGDLSEGQFTERLADFNLGFRETGSWDNKTAKDAMAEWAENANLERAKSNILAWNLSSAVPDFEKYVNNYWYANYGLGACDANSKSSIKKSNRDVDYICKDNAWVIATEYERDTYKWAACTKEGETKDGQASGRKYICKDKAWVLATATESDLGLCTTEGEIKSGYICKSKDWVPATQYELDTYQWVCTEGVIKDGQASGKKYICKDKTWATPTQYELDVGGLGSCSTAGEIRKGNVSDTKYTCKDKAWVEAKYIEIKCFESKSCQTFTDARDKQSYVYVKIGTQTWMSENLNYAADSSLCYDNEPANCHKYGRLYNWATAMKSCPTGWHIPSNAEWQTLVDFTGGEEAGTKLKSTSGWNTDGNMPGTDDFGFAALPGGRVCLDGSFCSAGRSGHWWSASEKSVSNAYGRTMEYDIWVVWLFDFIKSDLSSVRCLKD